MGWPSAQVAAAIVLVAASAARAKLICDGSAFRPPSLSGAEFTRINALPVAKWKVNATWPETRLYPDDGMDICNVTLTYRHADQKDTILVQVLLPDNWNGKFAAAGGGGFAAGKLDGEPMASLLALRYATATTDAGHDPHVWSHAPWALNSKGELNHALLRNFASLSIHEMATIGKDLVSQYYGRAPAYSYFSGCSTGGRQGITSAVEYPGDFDGILAGAPALNLADLSVAGYWPQFVMHHEGVYPHRCEFDAILDAEIAACDGLDGVEDGIISDPDACVFDPETLVGTTVQCNGNLTEGTPTSMKISEAAARIAARIRRGPTSEGGAPLFVGTPAGTPFTGLLAAANTNCNGASCVGEPFPMVVDWIRLLVHRNAKYDLGRMSARDLEETFVLSRRHLGPIFAGATNPDLSGFGSGNSSDGRPPRRMISWHGLADQTITAFSSRLYYDRVLARDANAREYYRHFEAPGVHHCGVFPGKPAFYPLHALDALVRWVEQQIAPDVLTGYHLPEGRGKIVRDPVETRPICMYPDVLRYVGGDPNAYGSFKCERRQANLAKEEVRDRIRDEL